MEISNPNFSNFNSGKNNYSRRKFYKKPLNPWKNKQNKFTEDEIIENATMQMDQMAFNPKSQKVEIDPYVAQAMIYRAEMYILTRYQSLMDINLKHQGLAKTLDDKSHFFVIKSFSEEDVHKAIKYSVWSSTKTGNQTLSTAFKISEEKKGRVYLFFSCNGSGRYVGVATMVSPCDYSKEFMYWAQDGKWPGLFDIEWVFIKDVPFRNFKNILITMKDGEVKPVSNARDTQEIPFAQGKTMMEIIENFQNTNTILEHFEYYDLRQENYEKQINPG